MFFRYCRTKSSSMAGIAGGASGVRASRRARRARLSKVTSRPRGRSHWCRMGRGRLLLLRRGQRAEAVAEGAEPRRVVQRSGPPGSPPSLPSRRLCRGRGYRRAGRRPRGTLLSRGAARGRWWRWLSGHEVDGQAVEAVRRRGGVERFRREAGADMLSEEAGEVVAPCSLPDVGAAGAGSCASGRR